MAKETDDLTGQLFDRWTVIGYPRHVPDPDRQHPRDLAVEWLCRCSCSARTERYVRAKNLIRRLSGSCGCRRSELASSRRVHGLSGTPTYATWLRMRARCRPGQHHRYGNRGISVCSAWQNSFATFVSSVGVRPSKGHTLDRINNDGGYWCGQCEECITANRPANCRWATWQTQARNTSHNRRLTLNGETRCVVEWAEVVSLPARTIYQRLSAGWSERDAVFTPYKSRRPSTVGRGRSGDNPASKLTVGTVELMIDALLAGDSVTAIASRFGVSRTAVSYVRRGVSWVYVRPTTPRPIYARPEPSPTQSGP